MDIVRTLNLGAGNKIVAEAVNHDISKHRPEIDVVHDLNVLPWPWADGSFDKIVAWSVFEHLNIDLVASLNECHRILRTGGGLSLKLPVWNSEGSYDDVTHRWRFSLRSLDQFCPETDRGRAYGFYTAQHWKYVKAPRMNKAGTSIYATLETL